MGVLGSCPGRAGSTGVVLDKGGDKHRTSIGLPLLLGLRVPFDTM